MDRDDESDSPSSGADERKRSPQLDAEIGETLETTSKSPRVNEGRSAGERPTLLSLPAEIRNKIWTHIFVGNIGHLTSSNPFALLPSVSKVCRKMLVETVGIFLVMTRFVVIVQDFDGAFKLDSCKHIEALGVFIQDLTENDEFTLPKFHPTLEMSGSPNWSNMYKWVKAIHASPNGVQIGHDRSGRMGYHIAEHVINTADLLRGKGMPWEDAETVLEHIHQLLALGDAGWQ